MYVPGAVFGGLGLNDPDFVRTLADIEWFTVAVIESRPRGESMPEPLPPVVIATPDLLRGLGVIRTKDKHGGDIEEFPPNLAIRELPWLPNVK